MFQFKKPLRTRTCTIVMDCRYVQNPAAIMSNKRDTDFDASKSVRCPISMSQQKSKSEILPINALHDKKGFLKVVWPCPSDFFFKFLSALRDSSYNQS